MGGFFGTYTCNGVCAGGLGWSFFWVGGGSGMVGEGVGVGVEFFHS